MSWWDDMLDAVSSLPSQIASGAEGAANLVASQVTNAANHVANGTVSAANSFASGAQSAAATAWSATSDQARYLARSLETAGLVVTDEVIAGSNVAQVGVTEGYEQVGRGAIALKVYVEENACSIGVGTGLAATFVVLSGHGLGAGQVATMIGNRALMVPAANGLAAVIAGPVSRLPGVRDSGISEDQLRTVSAFLIYRACKMDEPSARRGIGGFLVGALVSGLTEYICKGTVPGGYALWMAENAEALAVAPAASGVGAAFFEGQRVHQNGGLYLVLDGACCHIPNPQTYNNLFSTWSGYTEAGASTLRIGPALDEGAFLGHDARDGRVYLVSNGKKRHVRDPDTMNKCALGWDKIRPLGAGEADALTTARTIHGNTSYVDGSRIRTPHNGAIYVVLDGQPCHIPDIPTHENLFRPSSPCEQVHSADNVGPPLSSGAFLGHSAGKVYLVSNGVRRHVQDPGVMDKYAFEWGKVREMSAAELGATVVGPVLT